MSAMAPFVALACHDTPGFAAQVRDAVETHRAVLLTGGSPGGDHATFYRRIAEEIGNFHFKDENPDTGALDRSGWLDMRYDPRLAERHPYRYGNGRMGLHVDGSYSDVDFDIIFFYCEAPADFGGATTVIDGARIVECLRLYDAALLDELLVTPVIFGKGARTRTEHILRIVDGIARLNWNATRVAPENSAQVIDMAQRFDRFCEEGLVDGGVVRQVRLERGDALFLHNRLTLHGRCSFWGARCLMKGAITRAPASHPVGATDAIPAAK